MQSFQVAYHTDIGIKKKTNQDSILVKAVAKNEKEVLLAVLCDGMGGMDKGEVASASMVRDFSEWLTDTYIKQDKWNLEVIKEQWIELMEGCNRRLIQYGQEGGIQLGTTVTVLLVNSEGDYLIGHIGDTRVYHVADRIKQLTEDHTFVAREIKRGNMTPEQAKTDHRRNVLLQCVGVNSAIEPQFVEGTIKNGEAFLLCSDGLRHQCADSELLAYLPPVRFRTQDEIKKALVEVVELNKQRRETDNISAIYVLKV